jgi:inner membrane protein involved in colicin E2 resistance
VVAGPFLALTCEETYTEEREIKRDGKAQTVTERKTRACPTGYFPPRTLDVVAQMPVESLYRGIYRIRTYRATLDFSGDVEWPAPPASTPTFSRTWKKAYYVISVSDPRGIRSAATSTSSSLSRTVEDGRIVPSPSRRPSATTPRGKGRCVAVRIPRAARQHGQPAHRAHRRHDADPHLVGLAASVVQRRLVAR